MRGGEQKQGYTIVEVMIFLAISGFMFVIAAGFVSGKQAKTEFRQGMNDINSQIQQTINDVSNGFYPSIGGFSCVAGDSGVPTLSAGTNGQGSNKGCTFIGKVMQFGVDDASGSAYNTYSVVGRQFKPDVTGSSTLTPPADFGQAAPIAVTGAGNLNLTEKKNLKWGIQIDKMTNNGANIGAFGFFGGFATTTDSNLDSGAAAPIAVAIPDTALGQSASVGEQKIQELASANFDVNASPNIVMCFKGSAKQYGRLTIGTTDNVQGQKLATHIQISNGNPAAGCSA